MLFIKPKVNLPPAHLSSDDFEYHMYARLVYFLPHSCLLFGFLFADNERNW